MQIDKLTTTNRDGHRLSADVHQPLDGEAVAYAIFVHCLPDDRPRPASAIIDGLRALGVCVVNLRFAEADGAARAEDVRSVIDLMRSELGEPALLVGHSVGGSAALLAVEEVPSLKAMALIAVPTAPEYMSEMLRDASERSVEGGASTIALRGHDFQVSEDLMDEIAARGIVDAVQSLHIPILILHSPSDEIVTIDSAAHLFAESNHPKNFISIDDADHLLTKEGEADHVRRLLEAWFARYVRTGVQEAKYIRPDDNRTYTQTGESGYYTEILANGHALASDEPKSVGGTDAGPTPYDLVSAALGACTGMTLRMYADRKEWPLKGVKVRLHHQKIHARDCETCETEDENIDHIDREIVLDGPLSEDQRARLLEIANRCPVHQTLVEGVHVSTSEAEV